MGQIKIIWGSRAVLSVQTQKFLELCVSSGRMQPLTLRRARRSRHLFARVAMTPMRYLDDILQSICFIITKSTINPSRRARVNNRMHAGERASKRLNVCNCITARSQQKLSRPAIVIRERYAIIFANTICLRFIIAVRNDTQRCYSFAKFDFSAGAANF